MKLIEFKNHNKEILRGILDVCEESNEGILFIHGFERTTIEMKYKALIDQLRGGVNLFRFDFSGCGMSDGLFEDLTVEKLIKEVEASILAFKKEVPGLQKIHVVAHSLACCVALSLAHEQPGVFEKMVFYGPAFNQRELLRYFFAQRCVADPSAITWENYKEFLDEEKFKEAQNMRQMVKAHYLSPAYFLENIHKDYQELFIGLKTNLAHILVLEAENDIKVPIQSNNSLPEGIIRIKVPKADHDFERPDVVETYIRGVVKFLSNQ